MQKLLPFCTLPRLADALRSVGVRLRVPGSRRSPQNHFVMTLRRFVLCNYGSNLLRKVG